MVNVGPIALLAGLVVALIVLLWLDLHFFARGREPSFREAASSSLGWLVLCLLAAIPVLVLEGSEDAVSYTTVYLIERSLSLDNLFVFLLLFAYFGVAVRVAAEAALLRHRRGPRCAACSSWAAGDDGAACTSSSLSWGLEPSCWPTGSGAASPRTSIRTGT